jgi:hypothetical protein
MAFALRPREWFNLAKRHGWWQYLLHDDFYDEDGTAYQAEQDVEIPEQHPAPTLAEVRDDCDTLLDFTVARWHFSQDISVAWRSLNQSDVLRTIERRYAIVDNMDIQGTMLDVAACALAETGREFVSAAWNDFRKPGQLGSLAQASAACLAFEDGFSRVANALSDMDAKMRRENMYALSYFHVCETLDWIESNVLSPVTEEWGRLAAASRFNWGRAVSWLDAGRLVSLVALDALAAIVRPQSPLLRDYGPQLEDKPDQAAFEAVISQYVEHDPAPRVNKTVRFLVEHSDLLTLQ